MTMRSLEDSGKNPILAGWLHFNNGRSLGALIWQGQRPWDGGFRVRFGCDQQSIWPGWFRLAMVSIASCRFRL